jgi:hypothetical protein
MVLAGKVKTEVMGTLLAFGVQAVGLSGVDGGLVMARRRDPPDLGFVGEVEGVNGGVLRALMDQRFVPVIASIAIGDDGQAYNVNADVVAAELAVGLSAQKLVYMNGAGADRSRGRPALGAGSGGGPRPAGPPGRRRGRDDPEAGERRICAEGRCATRAFPRWAGGACPGHELFTPEGIGTMIAVDAPGEEGTP